MKIGQLVCVLLMFVYKLGYERTDIRKCLASIFPSER